MPKHQRIAAHSAADAPPARSAMAQVALLGTLTTPIQGTQVVDSANEAAVRAGVATATQHLRDVPALGVTATGATVGVANSRIGLRKGLTSANG